MKYPKKSIAARKRQLSIPKEILRERMKTLAIMKQLKLSAKQKTAHAHVMRAGKNKKI